jgi:hypothetical protein
MFALLICIPVTNARHRHHKKTREKNTLDYYQPQNGLGGISGKVMGDLKPVAGVTLMVMQNDKLMDKTTSDENGYFTFKYLAPGHYDLKATNNDYRTTIITGIPVSADYIIKNDFYLPRFNNAHMPRTPAVETYRDHLKYLKHKLK